MNHFFSICTGRNILIGIAKSTVKVWIERYNNSGSFDVDDNRSEEEKELIELRKKRKQLDMNKLDLL